MLATRRANGKLFLYGDLYGQICVVHDYNDDTNEIFCAEFVHNSPNSKEIEDSDAEGMLRNYLPLNNLNEWAWLELN